MFPPHQIGQKRLISTPLRVELCLRQSSLKEGRVGEGFISWVLERFHPAFARSYESRSEREEIFLEVPHCTGAH